MRLLLCGGGTAGHINPAIAIAEELMSSDPNSKILFIGREGGDENSLIKKAGFNYKTINILGLKRSFSLSNIKRVLTALKALNMATKIIKEFNPDVILGTGGYVCWPIITAGKRMGIPTAIHESNIIPGLTTKLLARKCDLVLLNREEAKRHLSNSTNFKTVGNPLRNDFKKTGRKDARAKLKVGENDCLIVSFGGSIGSEKMNDVIIDLMKTYTSKEKNIRHIHAVGKRYYKEIEKANEGLGGCSIVPFIEDMPEYLNAADIVICRCGAMTISEICEVGVPAILIPSPNVAANHQLANGNILKNAGGAILIEEKNLNVDTLKNAVIKLKSDKNGRKTRAKTLKALSTPNSAKDIVFCLFSLLKTAK